VALKVTLPGQREIAIVAGETTNPPPVRGSEPNLVHTGFGYRRRRGAACGSNPPPPAGVPMASRFGWRFADGTQCPQVPGHIDRSCDCTDRPAMHRLHGRLLRGPARILVHAKKIGCQSFAVPRPNLRTVGSPQLRNAARYQRLTNCVLNPRSSQLWRKAGGENAFWALAHPSRSRGSDTRARRYWASLYIH
jgi:hypothetical protein